MTRPVMPAGLGAEQRFIGIAMAERVVVRGIPAHGERHRLARLNHELADGSHVGRAAQHHWGDELDRVGACDRDRAAEMLAYPRNAASVIEAQDDLGTHPHPTFLAVDQADQIDLIFSFLRQGHEIDDFGVAF